MKIRVDKQKYVKKYGTYTHSHNLLMSRSTHLSVLYIN